MHSPLSLAVGYNRLVTHGRRSCNNVVAILAKDKTFSLCSRCETPVLRGPDLYTVVGRAGWPHPLWRGLPLRPPLRVARDLGWCDHDYRRWDVHNTTPRCVARLPVRGAPVPIMGSEFPQCTWLRPFASPHS